MSSHTFADLFRSIVAPRLREMCRRRGVLVAYGIEPFSTVVCDIMREALRLGAERLTSAALYDLEDSVSIWLIEAAAEAEPMIEQAREQARL